MTWPILSARYTNNALGRMKFLLGSVTQNTPGPSVLRDQRPLSINRRDKTLRVEIGNLLSSAKKANRMDRGCTGSVTNVTAELEGSVGKSKSGLNSLGEKYISVTKVWCQYT